MALNQKIRLLIVDDSIFFRKTLASALASDQRVEVVGQAVDAMDAMNKIQALNPDVVTLDVEMPKLNGIDFLKKLMPVHPVPVVVVSSAPIQVLDALSAGAVEFIRKPEIKGPDGMRRFISELSVKIRIAYAAKSSRRFSRPAAAPATTPAAPTPAVSAPAVSAPAPAPAVSNSAAAATAAAASAASATASKAPLTLSRLVDPNIVIAIGASTGGTEAILEVVQNLPENTPGIVIVQHMPPVFTRMYAQRLDRICKMSVKEAANGDRVERGLIIIGAGEYHLRLAKDSSGYYVRSESGPKVSGHCPSVDVLFDSVATVAGSNAMGVILTGMGADGAKGLLRMRQAGAYTVGQDKDSCVVYGMPMVAFNNGAVKAQLPLGDIGGEIVRYLNTRRPL